MRFFLRSMAPYAAAVLACLAILAPLMELWRLDLSVPLRYRQDALLGQVWVKGLLDHGWYLKNPQLGAPLRSEMHDFPAADNLHFGIIKLLGRFSSRWPVVYNLYFLLTFPLAALSSLFALRQLGIKGPAALVISQLYAFLPYHWNRGEFHLFLSAYYIVPLSILVAIWIYLNQLAADRRALQHGPSAPDSSRRRRWFSALVCLLQASAGAYYAFFASFLFVVAGAAAAWRAKSPRACLPAVLFLSMTILGVLANTAPSLAYWHRRGANPEVAHRPLGDAEVYALRMTPLLLPVEHHNLRPLADLRDRYNIATTFVNESASATLGAVGSLGFLGMLGWMLFVRSTYRRSPLVNALVTMNLALVLLATEGGLGMLFNLLVHPQIRAYNRASVFIAFCSLAAVAIWLQRIEARCGTARARAAFLASLAILLTLGILDQSSFDFVSVPRWEAQRNSLFLDDAEFVGRMEAALPPGAAVYQLPYADFPEGSVVHSMDNYEHFRPYLHCRSLRFSHGAMHGREADRWHHAIQWLPTDKFLDAIMTAGFQAIYVDRQGYSDRAKQLEAALRQRFHRDPLESRSGDVACFILSPVSEHVTVAANPAQDNGR